MKLGIDGFNVAAVYADDLEKTVSFYAEVLGFEKIADVGGGVQMKLAGDPGLSIYLQGGYPADARGYASSKISLCFNTPSVKRTFDNAIAQNLTVTFAYKEVAPGYAMFCISDPSGNQIMFTGSP